MQNIIETIKNWPIKQKIIFFSIIFFSVAGMVILFSWLQSADYRILYSNLIEDDIALIVQQMKEMKIPYKIEFGNVLVPSNMVYDLRLQFAAQGLPHGGSIGFELFDKNNFGTTNFVQKINFRRALQGELARTIRSVTEVDQCRVHLSIPEKSIFVTEKEKPRASILIKLKPGRRLTQSQVQGMVHLISSSVEGLDPNDVTIVNNRGEMLTHQTDDGIGFSSSQLEYQNNYEKAMESRIRDILEPVVGRGKVRAKVTATVDFTRRESTEERFDPDGQVARSEQKDTEKEMTAGKGGVPGVASNLPGKAKVSSSANILSQKKNETINYEISKVTKHVINSFGDIKRLTAAVLVDGVYTKQEGSGEMKYVPRSEEELKRYEDLAKKAIGFTEERGDEAKVVNMPFQVVPREEFSESPREYLPSVITMARYVVPLLIAFFFFLFVLRPLTKALSVPQANQKIPELPLSQAATGLEGGIHPKEIPSEEIPKVKSMKNNVIEWVKKNPQQATNLVKGWMDED